ncbi:MAG TPA: hypothetical protein VI911_07930 [Patescibacteria group bacterium]|jgi:hypothetical protein|nr:hypothetical protein [Patescibacteria group bacterium]
MPGCTVCLTFSGTAQELWEVTHGTTAYGNLPQYKKDQHVGNKWNPCPYSTQSDDLRSAHRLGIVPTKVDHTDDAGKVYYMSPDRRNSWGYACTFDNCPYLLTNGRSYFYK